MKLTRRNYIHYVYGQKMRPRHFAWLSKFRAAYPVVLFCVISLSFTMLFSTVPEGDRAATSARQIATVSAHGKTGVSRPDGVTAAKKAASKGLFATPPKILGSSAPLPLSIPPKPSWVYKTLYTDPTNGAAQYLAANPGANGANYIARLARVPVADWFGDWNTDVRNDVDAYVSAAAATGSVPIVVAYNIPNRDCGGYSVGGASGIAAYTQWMQQVAAGIGDRTAVVVVEPDALGALDCLTTSQQQERSQSIATAIPILKAHTQTTVYLDAGTPVWQPANVMAQRLTAANIAAADGFSLNISYFASTAQNRAYGDQLSSLIGYKHYVIDTSRNGGNNAVTGMQCNPPFASFGQTPTTTTGSALNDALLWIKIPWESDGACNGSPGPGQEYWSYAIQLAQNAGL
jgi:endoglucanase